MTAKGRQSIPVDKAVTLGRARGQSLLRGNVPQHRPMTSSQYPPAENLVRRKTLDQVVEDGSSASRPRQIVRCVDAVASQVLVNAGRMGPMDGS